MLLDAGILALLVGAAVGRGRLSRVRDLDLRAPGVFVFAALAKIAVAILGWRGATVGILVGGPVNVLAYLLLLVGLLLNRHLWGMRVAAVGVLLNFLVIAANGGSMAVDRDLAVRAGNRTLVQLLDSPAYVSHKPIHAGTRLRPLADVLPLPLLFPRPRFFAPGSIGDVVVTFGACWLILSALGAFGLGRRGPSGEAERGQGEAAL